MVLIYIDESGDTGTNFNDTQQPIFVLGAMLVQQNNWKKLENNFQKVLKEAFKQNIPPEFELHAMDLVNRKNHFRDFSLEGTLEFRNRLFQLLEKSKLPVFYRKIDKKRYSDYCQKRFGSGIKIDPYIMAFPFVSLRVDSWLEEQNELGIFIFDEHRSLIDIEQSLRALRLPEKGGLHVEHIIEKGFFINSLKSFPLQLIDLILYYIRKYEEAKIGKKVSDIHRQVFPYIERLTENLDQHDKGLDIIDWIDGRVKK